MMNVTNPASAPQNPRLKRLRFRSWRRGFREMDLILGHFADQHLDKLGPEDLDRYEALLGAPDQDLYAWLTDRAPVPDEHDHAVMALIKSFRYFARTLWAETAQTGAAAD
ncbi:MAG: succinate dehydrogenase assembly factor 2 [Maricaulaceae bacterium]